MVIVAPYSSTLIERHGSRNTLLLGFIVCMAGFSVMLFGWNIHTPMGIVILSYVLIGIGVGFAGTPASHALTDSVPVTKVGMASGTSDLQRDLGGSIFQAILGTFLTLGYAAAFAKQVTASPEASQVSAATQSELASSYAGATKVSEQFPQYQSAIISAAQESFLQGAGWAFAAGALFIVIGALLVFFAYPSKQNAIDLFAEYQKEDANVTAE